MRPIKEPRVYMCEGGLRVISYFILFSPFDELLGHAPDDCFKKFPCMSRTVFVRPLVLIVLIDGRAREKGWTEVGESALPKSRPRSSSPCSIFLKMTEKISVQEIRKIKKRKQWLCQRDLCGCRLRLVVVRVSTAVVGV